MVVTRRAAIAPDERCWLVWGRDLRAEGYVPAAAPASAEVLVAPERIPEGLAGALRETWQSMPSRRELVTPADPLGYGEPARRAVEDGGHAMHEEHGGHDHHAMMAVTGEPSADGLVMEDLEFELGPLSPVLPGGLVARLTVDGDVVCGAALSATFEVERGPVPDPSVPAAWRVAAEYGDDREHGRTPPAGVRARRVVAVELERALSHSAWLADIGALLGWLELADAGRRTAAAVLSARSQHAGGLGAAERAAQDLGRLLAGSRRLRFRLGGLAPLTAGDARGLGLAGPNARAAGLAVDARSADPAYAALGFTAAVEQEGDAAARARLRAAELVASLVLVRRVTVEGLAVEGAGLPTAVEGPRGPLAVPSGPSSPAAGGADALLEAVAERVRGLEWSAAMAAIASFDLSGWKAAA